MSRPFPLRLRFALLAMLLGLALSVLASLALMAAAEEYESIVSDEILRGQADDYARELSAGMPAALPQTRRLRGYRIDDPALPRAYAALPPGMNEDPADEDTHIGVFDTAVGRLVLVIDLGDIEASERRLHAWMLLVTVLGTMLSGWLGWLLAGPALKPVRALAECVEALPVQPQATALATGVSRDDLGRLARAIDGYQARLVDADAGEQAFLADASHELRTPLAVVQGALEVLQDDASASAAQQARLARIERGVGEMRRLLEAMLAAARRKPLQLEAIPVRQLLEDVADMALSDRSAGTITLDGDGTLQTDPREAVLLLAGLARGLLRQSAGGHLHLGLETGMIHMRLVAEGSPAAASTSLRADTGTGSALLDRLAARLGWKVRFDSPHRVSVDTRVEGCTP
ncbi:HAMP domain-containing sensor histidine kinase [Thermomonas sp.]|uniref:sensor histidine kinase n=1 Tax=Thermomonas sp. TaxID=1971895 RepID=UPI002602B1F1|nr:HAMP domain-containing sensor histidine kinase [Thermomonas sp.]